MQYKYNRKLIEFICDNCGINTTKPESEYKRNTKLNRHNFCSRSCAMTYANLHKLTKVDTWVYSIENKQHILQYSNNRKDEYTKFKYTFRNIQKRFKEFDLTIKDLKEIWNTQNGICPYTGLQLILPTYRNIKTIPIINRASLDRIDSSQGYIKTNIQFVSTPINLLKNTMSDLDTKKYLKLISKYTSTFIED